MRKYGPSTDSIGSRCSVPFRCASLTAIFLFAFLVVVDVAQAAGFKPPEECQAYTGEAHLNCLYAYIELQQSQLGRIEEELKAQKQQLRQLGDQVQRNASTTAPALERAAPIPPDPVYVPVPTPVPQTYYYPYAYPPFGFSLYLGAPGYYGYYGPRFWGPRYYGGPRFYGSRGGRWGRR